MNNINLEEIKILIFQTFDLYKQILIEQQKANCIPQPCSPPKKRAKLQQTQFLEQCCSIEKRLFLLMKLNNHLSILTNKLVSLTLLLQTEIKQEKLGK